MSLALLIGCGKKKSVYTSQPAEPMKATLTSGMETAKKAHDEGRYVDAAALYIAELSTEEAKPAPSWVQLSHLNNELGLALDNAGQYDKALEYFQKDLAILLKKLGADHPYVAGSYNNIGAVHRAKGEYDKALKYHQKALTIRLKKLGPDHPDVAISYSNIGVVHDDKGEYDEALEYYQKALAIWLKQLGPDHPSVAISYNNMALVYKAKKNLPKAKEYWEKAYAIRIKKLGPNHPDTKDTKAQLDALNK